MITDLKAREILDSRGNPTVEIDLTCDGKLYRASVPSGASTGIYEAMELRDDDKARYSGKGVLCAVKNINDEIAPRIKGMDPTNQEAIDKKLLEIDGTKNKSSLGANAILAVSMAACRAGAFMKGMDLYEHIGELAKREGNVLPVPSFNIINGGKHAGNLIAPQEFMILPTGVENFKEALRAGSEIYHTLKKMLKDQYGSQAVNVGDEGGFAPNCKTAKEILDIITEAIKKAGYEGKVKIGMDVAASEFCVDGKYDLNFKNEELKGRELKTSGEMVDYYLNLIDKYDIVSIEDPFDQDDWLGYAQLLEKTEGKIQIVGDDLLVTNPERIKKGIMEKACNGLLLKINQIGTITEAIAAFAEAKKAGWGVMVSHRSGETEDTFIADLTVGLNAGEIKTGAPCRGERLAKYNQLLRIEEELGENCKYAGEEFRTI